MPLILAYLGGMIDEDGFRRWWEVIGAKLRLHREMASNVKGIGVVQSELARHSLSVHSMAWLWLAYVRRELGSCGNADQSQGTRLFGAR
jgi:hypothetical protein